MLVDSSQGLLGNEREGLMKELNTHLLNRTYMVGHNLSLADIAMWESLKKGMRWTLQQSFGWVSADLHHHRHSRLDFLARPLSSGQMVPGRGRCLGEMPAAGWSGIAGDYFSRNLVNSHRMQSHAACQCRKAQCF